jgi:predicted exporter
MSLRRRISVAQILPFFCIIAIFASGGIVASKIIRGNSIDTDILSLLPASQSDPTLAAALQRLNEVASSRVAFMLDGSTAENRGKAAVDLTDSLVKAGLLRPSAEDGAEAWNWLFAHRTGLLCPDDKTALQQDRGQVLAQDALTRWYSPLGFSNSALLKSDPLLLTPRLMSCSLKGLVGNGATANASIVSGSILGPVFATSTQDHLESVSQAWKARWPAVKLYRAGAIFHAEHAASSARFQMSLISAATGALILLIYLLMFKSIRPPLLAILLIASCLTIGLATTLLFYDRIHVMVIVFASALIGMVVDYSTYYLITGVARPDDTAQARRRSIFRPLTLGMATSVAAFAALLASPIAAFRQIAILGSVGLFAAWVLALYVLPILEGRRRAQSAFATRAKTVAFRALNWHASSITGGLLVGTAAVLAVIATVQGNVLDDIRRFQTPAPDLATEEAYIREATGFVAPSAFVLVTGRSANAQKRNEEVLLGGLAGDQKTSGLVALAASQFDPSQETETANGALIQTKLLKDNLRPLLSQLSAATEDPYAQSEGSGPALPSFVTALRGQTEADFWSIVPLTAAASAIPATAISGPNARLVDPATAYSALLGEYRWTATMGLVGGTIVTGVTLLLVYRRLLALWILLPTVLAMLTAPAVLALAGVPYSFFSAMALFLVIGAGVDYSIFQWEHRDSRAPWTRLGIALAALMTCTSLGLLGFSSIYPVASFGMTVALGIFLSLALSPLIALGYSEKGSAE